MAVPQEPPLALLVIASFSKHLSALEWAHQRLEVEFGPISEASQIYSFHHTKYYTSVMGEGLQKQLLAFRRLVTCDQLATIKLKTNQLEVELAKSARYGETRPINLDPGLLTLGKFTLATTKDQSHRIYLGQGIYAEVTLRFHAGQYEPWPWTYADYREPEVLAILKRFRDAHRDRLNVEGD